MLTAARYIIGTVVWRRNISPLRYGTGRIVAIDLRGVIPEYGVLFDGCAASDIRWYTETELLP